MSLSVRKGSIVLLWLTSFYLNSALSAQNSLPELGVELKAFSIKRYVDKENVNESRFAAVLSHDTECFKEYKSGRNKFVIGNILTAPSMLILFISIQGANNGNPPYFIQWVLGIGGTISGCLLYYRGKRQVLDAISLFNARQGYSIGVSANGIQLNFYF